MTDWTELNLGNLSLLNNLLESEEKKLIILQYFFKRVQSSFSTSSLLQFLIRLKLKFV